jgi:hypothetical protein
MGVEADPAEDEARTNVIVVVAVNSRNSSALQEGLFLNTVVCLLREESCLPCKLKMQARLLP